MSHTPIRECKLIFTISYSQMTSGEESHMKKRIKCHPEEHSERSCPKQGPLAPCVHLHLSFNSLKLNRIKKFSALVTLAIFQVFNSHMWPVAVILDSADIEHSFHCRKFFWIVLSYNHPRKEFFPSCRLENKPREVLQPARDRGLPWSMAFWLQVRFPSKAGWFKSWVPEGLCLH